MNDPLLERALRLLAETGPAIRIRYVAAAAGVSKDKVLDDGKRGEYELKWQKCHTRRYAVIEREEAKRYVERVTAA